MSTRARLAALGLLLLLLGGGLWLAGLLGDEDVPAASGLAGDTPEAVSAAPPLLRGHAPDPGRDHAAGAPGPASTAVGGARGAAPGTGPAAGPGGPGRAAGANLQDAPINTAPDVLEAQLLLEGVPVTQGRGLLWAGGSWTTAGQIPVEAEPARSVELTAEGVLRFGTLEAGDYYLGVVLDDGLQRLYYVKHTAGKAPNPRATLEIGTAAVTGTVYGAFGRPLEGALVRVGATGRGFLVQTRTDRDGRYAIGRLPPGPAWVTFALTGDLDDATQTHYRTFVLESGREAVMDHGAPIGDAQVMGVVRCKDGVTVRKPGLQLILERQGRDGFVIVPVDAEGRFDQQVARGTYRVHIRPGGAVEETVPEAPLVVDRERVEVELVLPGARVVGWLDASGGPPVQAWVSLEPAPTDPPGPRAGRRAAAVAADGSFVFYGVPAGVYSLWGGAVPQAQAVRLEVRAGDVEVRQDLGR